MDFKHIYKRNIYLTPTMMIYGFGNFLKFFKCSINGVNTVTIDRYIKSLPTLI